MKPISIVKSAPIDGCTETKAGGRAGVLSRQTINPATKYGTRRVHKFNLGGAIPAVTQFAISQAEAPRKRDVLGNLENL